MLTFIELWKAKKKWLYLSTKEKTNYLSQLTPSLPGFMEKGVEIHSWGQTTESSKHGAGYDFFAGWTFPNNDTLSELKGMLEAAQWYDYFDQVNISGVASSPDIVIGKLIAFK